MSREKLISLAVLSPVVLLSGCSDILDYQQQDQIKEFLKHLPFVVERKEEPFLDQSYSFMMNIFSLVKDIVLWTPPWLFNNDWFKPIMMMFSGISLGFVTVLSMIEGIKRMLGLSHTSLRQIATRLPVAMTVTSLAPFAFVKGVEWLNKTCDWVVSFAEKRMFDKATIDTVKDFTLTPLEDLLAFGFNVVLIITVIPILLHHGKRWFNLVTLGIITPLAMVSYVFDSLSNYHSMWWNSIKKLSLIQLVYAVYITILTILIVGTPFPTSASGLFTKMLVSIGGLWQLAFPPRFITSLGDSGMDSQQMISRLFDKVVNFPHRQFSIKNLFKK